MGPRISVRGYVRGSVGPLVCRSVGRFVHRFVGPLVRWSVGPLVRRSVISFFLSLNFTRNQQITHPQASWGPSTLPATPPRPPPPPPSPPPPPPLRTHRCSYWNFLYSLWFIRLHFLFLFVFQSFFLQSSIFLFIFLFPPPSSTLPFS